MSREFFPQRHVVPGSSVPRPPSHSLRDYRRVGHKHIGRAVAINMAVRWEHLEGIIALAVQEYAARPRGTSCGCVAVERPDRDRTAQGIDGSRSGIRERIMTTLVCTPR